MAHLYSNTNLNTSSQKDLWDMNIVPNLSKPSPSRILDEDDERHFCPFLELYLMKLIDQSCKVLLEHLQGTRESKLREQDGRDNGYRKTVSVRPMPRNVSTSKRNAL